jgi:uncharacterized damage-inducible protein DinB
VTTVAELAEMLTASRNALLRAASAAGPERAALRPAAGEWSVLEVLAHLVDCDYHYTQQALAMRDNPNHMLVHFDDAAWKAEHTAIRETPFADIVALLKESHASVLDHLASMTDNDLDSPGLHPRGIPYSVRHVFLRFPQHDENHTRQIEQILAAI